MRYIGRFTLHFYTNFYWFMILVTGIRLTEIVAVALKFEMSYKTLFHESIGLLFDWGLAGILSLFLTPLTLIFSRYKPVERVIRIVSLSIVSIGYLGSVWYFLYQLEPLDVFLYHYNWSEIFFTLKTTDINLMQFFISAIILLVIAIGSFYFFPAFENRKNKTWPIFSLILFPAVIASNFHNISKYSSNKAFYFCKSSIDYFNETIDFGDNFTISDASDFQKLFPGKYLSKTHPFLRQTDIDDKLNEYIQPFDDKPNIVILIVEGLSDDFIHPYHGMQLMPYLHHLSRSGLYWNRNFSLGERSFAVVPSLLGSLPYAKIGFTIQNNYPKHISLPALLKRRGYATNFFYAQGAWFHNKSVFFEYQHIDRVVDKDNFEPNFKKIITPEYNYFWGYHDKDLYRQSFKYLNDSITQPYMNIYFTGTSHSPFVIDKQEHYEKRLSDLSKNLPPDEMNFVEQYKTYLLSLLFADDAIQEFFTTYMARPEYENTVFIITGDHAMSEIPSKNQLKKYHVPLIIYSPKIKNHKIFDNPVSHLDFLPSFLGWIGQYVGPFPKTGAFLGTGLFSKHENPIILMNGIRQTKEIYFNERYLNGAHLYKVTSNFDLIPVKEESQKEDLKNKIKLFNKTNNYTCCQHKLLPDSNYFEWLNISPLMSFYSDSIQFSQPYFNILEVKVSNRSLLIDVALKTRAISSETQIVYQVKNSNDSLIFWKNCAIVTDENFFSKHLTIPNLPTEDSITVSCYLWNKSQKLQRFETFSANIYIHPNNWTVGNRE